MTGLDHVPIEKARLSVRTTNALKSSGYSYVGLVVNASDKELLRLPGFGSQALTEVRSVLSGAYKNAVPPAVQRINELESALGVAYGFLSAIDDPRARPIAERAAAVLWPTPEDDEK